jgi:cob(I)alamin adenosyltransferase
MKIYTKTGDDGTTGLLAGRRVLKDDLRVEAYGTIDELNAALGLARAERLEPALDAVLAHLQETLFVLGSALADPNPTGRFHSVITADHVAWLERQIDEMQEHLPPLTHFILPGGSKPAALVHWARAVCRRAERLIVSLSRRDGEVVPEQILTYVNRLSDFLFVLARAINHAANTPEAIWKGLA